jgi:glycosyltransferase involved in cell wall biosynthesis
VFIAFKALKSVIDQQYANLEVVVVDDGSQGEHAE